jgi:hypothetical protein
MDETLPKRAQIIGIQINSALRSTFIMVVNTKAGKVVCIKKLEIDLPSLVLMKPKLFNRYPIVIIANAEPKTTLGEFIMMV